MFCNQCEQTAQGKGCAIMGVCGKSAEIAAIQDLIVYATRGLAVAAIMAAQKNTDTLEAGRVCIKALFSCLTNVNFDKAPLLDCLETVVKKRDGLMVEAKISSNLPVLQYGPAQDMPSLLKQAEMASITHITEDVNTNSLAQTLLFGLKGLSAYADHAYILGYERQSIYNDLFQLLAAGFDGKDLTLDDWIQSVLACGTLNLNVMELLDKANTETFGNPEPTAVSLIPVEGKAILVTGHDLKDLYDLLVQTEGKGISVYTHGEMLPAHAYPGLKKFKHLVGHFGTAWQNQQKELRDFPGAILFTTNCIQKPAAEYASRVFTTGLVGWQDICHVENGHFEKVIDCALTSEGFKEQSASMPTKSVLTGFAHNAVMGVADTVIKNIKEGSIRHIFLVGGCDGAKSGRNYYTQFVEQTPQDTLVLTLACGKFRFFDKQLGNINGIPRLLDMGQCNDAYSAVKVALALSEAFSCSVNELPLSLILSWYEQKAVAILLSLLSLGIKGIRLGPTLPAFISPTVLDVLIKTFDIKPITTPEQDLKDILG